MPLAKEDLQAIADIMDEKLEPVKSEIKSIRQDIKKIKADVAYTKDQVDILYGWVDGIDLDVKTLKRG